MLQVFITYNKAITYFQCPGIQTQPPLLCFHLPSTQWVWREGGVAQ